MHEKQYLKQYNIDLSSREQRQTRNHSICCAGFVQYIWEVITIIIVIFSIIIIIITY